MNLKYAILNKIGLLPSYLLSKNSGLKNNGWFLSYLKISPVNLKGEPIPWITYPAINFLEKRLKNLTVNNVFEYGSGNSSLWWTKFSSNTFSVEHDQSWFKTVNQTKTQNLNIYLEELNSEEYINKSNLLNTKFEIIVVDGRRRVECAKRSINALTDNGILILDNSNREEYKEIFDFYKSKNFKHIEFIGMTPMGVEESETTIFYRANNLLNL